MRRLGSLAIAGLIATGGVLFAQAPAFAATSAGAQSAATCKVTGSYKEGGKTHYIVECTDN